MSTSNTTASGGLGVTLRAALNAGWLTGLVSGVADGLVAGSRTGPRGAAEWLGCLAAASLVYGLFWIVVALALGIALQRFLRAQPLGERVARLSSWTLGLALFLDLYWWTRPYLFPGLPATDPKRLATAALLLVAGMALGFTAIALGRKLPRAVLWVGAVLVPASWVGGLIFLSTARADADALGALNARNQSLPNVVLIVCDALRADALGCYGNARAKTPNIDALAARGVLFEQAFVQAPFTGSSFGSFFTGKYPRRHGLVKMKPGLRMLPNVTLAWLLKTGAFTAGGALERDDYHNVTFMTGALSQSSGLMRGFDSYFEAFMGHDLVELASPWSVFQSELVLSVLKAKLKQRFSDEPVADEAVRWLADNGRKRFAALVHLFATHTPYDPPQRFRELFCDPAYAGPVRAFRAEHRMLIEAGTAAPSAADVQQIRDLYAAGVAHDDEMIGAVLAELERLGVLGETLVIVTSDHGEELGDHGLWEHNHMFQTNLRVPLVVAWPGRLPAGKRVSGIVESIDLLPTVCDLLGLKAPFESTPDGQGRNYGALDGVSVLPLVRGEVASVKPFSFCENGNQMAVQDREWKLIVAAVPLHDQTLATLAEHKAFPPRLYHLADDPDERVDVSALHPDQAQRLLDALAAWDAQMPIARNVIEASDRDLEQQRLLLEQLGYVDGKYDPPPTPPRQQ